MIKLQHIEMLLAIDRAGSIRAASKLLNRTQPAVTKALRQAEAELGTAIFKRAPSGVAVTEEGKTVLRRARVIQSELRKMDDEIAQRRGLGTGRLNVTVSPLAANRLMAGTIKRFRRRFPGVHVQITGGHEPMAFGPVRDGLVDLVIGPEPQSGEAAGLSVQFLVETPIKVITGLGSRWSGARSLADLVDGDWLMIGSRERLPYMQRRFIAQGFKPPEPMVTSDSIFSVLSMLQDSDFLCTFPGLLLDQTMSTWRIQGLDLSPPLLPARIAATTASERPPTPALQYFSDCILQVAQNEFS
ncbi:LysR substrate-binding domain-containing protein [Antarctobacter sp.]|uniref:LysR substrate-binding domain-containing protein n=1 Tax=Antarctobacter sp. TaxID=1872577 RepID=UPI002B271700|nr:LysR substrate-binding domain-containing protein [Antarctobacter sp.]